MNKKLIISYILLIVWMALIYLFSSDNQLASDNKSSIIVNLLPLVGIVGDTGVLTHLIRKSAHFFMYFVLGMLAYNAFRLHIKSMRLLIVSSTAFVVFYAISDEIHQLLVPGRSGEVRDVIIDSVAGVIGITLVHILASRSKINRGRSTKEY